MVDGVYACLLIMVHGVYACLLIFTLQYRVYRYMNVSEEFACFEKHTHPHLFPSCMQP